VGLGIVLICVSGMKEKHRAKSKYKSHILIPDLQVRADVDYGQLEHIANYALHAQPDCIIQIGDWSDLPSLSTFDAGKLSGEGRRLRDDIQSVRDSVNLFMKPFRQYNKGRRKKYEPRFIITLGNHCFRLQRFMNDTPAFAGYFSNDLFGFKEAGFEVYPFLEIANVDGIEYTHFVQASCRGNPISSAAGLLRARHTSISTGHALKVEIAYHSGTNHIGLIAGAAYSHRETWAGQSDISKRGIWRKEEIRNSTYDPCYVSLEYLKKRWS
jgi:hypothetical protein